MFLKPRNCPVQRLHEGPCCSFFVPLSAAKQTPPGSQGADPSLFSTLPQNKAPSPTTLVPEALRHRLALLGGGVRNPERVFVSCLIITKGRNLPYFFRQHEESRSSSEQGCGPDTWFNKQLEGSWRHKFPKWKH